MLWQKTKGRFMSLSNEDLIDYITRHFNVNRADLDNGQLLFSNGLLDSFNMLDVIAFIEERAGITIGSMEINLDNLDSVDRIIDFVTARTADNRSLPEADSP